MPHAAPPHAAAFAALLLALLLAFVTLDRIAAASPGPGQLWILARGAPGPAMARIAAQVDGRVLDARAGGRLLVLHVDRLSTSHPAAADAWLVLRLPATLGGLPGCA